MLINAIQFNAWIDFATCPGYVVLKWPQWGKMIVDWLFPMHRRLSLFVWYNFKIYLFKMTHSSGRIPHINIAMIQVIYILMHNLYQDLYCRNTPIPDLIYLVWFQRWLFYTTLANMGAISHKHMHPMWLDNGTLKTTENKSLCIFQRLHTLFTCMMISL